MQQKPSQSTTFTPSGKAEPRYFHLSTWAEDGRRYARTFRYPVPADLSFDLRRVLDLAQQVGPLGRSRRRAVARAVRRGRAHQVAKKVATFLEHFQVGR